LTEDTIDSADAAERAEVIEAMTVEQQVEIKAEIAGLLILPQTSSYPALRFPANPRPSSSRV
jgi:hypothetical protein